MDIKKTFQYGFGFTALLLLLFISYLFFNSAPTEKSVKPKLISLVDLVLAQDNLEVDLAKLKYSPEGVYTSAFGFLAQCHPNIRNRNMIELEETTKITWNLSLRFNKQKIKNFFSDTPCLSGNEVRLYAVHVENGKVVGWSIDLEKRIQKLEY